ncbi:hypothetical protein HPB50_019541 [Hyalomma asiaticum]|uniref:Uncharacterized protein n=1 Tax=Hyalomma asiaticum TaxID=266040 RepID=A0ACB7SXG0_HYAAI|nr:hypothetical protein HPB50_019541 [Hyalomma asiaticum]
MASFALVQRLCGCDVCPTLPRISAAEEISQPPPDYASSLECRLCLLPDDMSLAECLSRIRETNVKKRPSFLFLDQPDFYARSRASSCAVLGSLVRDWPSSANESQPRLNEKQVTGVRSRDDGFLDTGSARLTHSLTSAAYPQVHREGGSHLAFALDTGDDAALAGRSGKIKMGLQITVEPVVFLFFSTMHLEMSAVQDIINTKCCFRHLNTTNVADCHSAQNQTRTDIKAEASVWIAFYYGTMSVLTLICGMWVGSWNDRFGPQIYLTYTFLTDEPLRWTASHYSFLQGINIAVEGVALLVVLPLAYRFLNISDAFAGLLGSVSRFLGLLWLGLCTTTSMVYFIPVLFVFSEFTSPSIRALLSKIVAVDEKGKAFAVMSALQSFAMFTGSLLFNGLYPATSKFFKGFGFEFAAALQLIPIGILLYLYFRFKREAPYAEIEGESMSSNIVES